MAQSAEILSKLEAKKGSLDERFEQLAKDLSPCFQEPDLVVEFKKDRKSQSSKSLDMGNYKTPVLSPGGRAVRFLAFLPNSEHGLYSPSILCQVDDSEVYLRQNRLAEPDKEWRPDGPPARESLEELEKLAEAYTEIAFQLSAKDARLMGFSDEFVKRQTKVRQVGRSLAKSLRLVGN